MRLRSILIVAILTLSSLFACTHKSNRAALVEVDTVLTIDLASLEVLDSFVIAEVIPVSTAEMYAYDEMIEDYLNTDSLLVVSLPSRCYGEIDNDVTIETVLNYTNATSTYYSNTTIVSAYPGSILAIPIHEDSTLANYEMRVTTDTYYTRGSNEPTKMNWSALLGYGLFIRV